MADNFLSGLQNHRQSFSLSDFDPSIEFLLHFSGLNPTHQLNFQSLIGYPNHKSFTRLSDSETFPGLYMQDISSMVVPSATTNQTITNENGCKEKKRKATVSNAPQWSSANSFPQVSADGKMVKNNSRTGKKAKCAKKEEGNGMPREVVHVRAKRGQATDSHSLAERVRREKIKERIRCLQDIVPGCYKTMGMAVMLDEIINYVQSLQNQVEFLSLKLTAASTNNDFNPDMDIMEVMQGLPLYIFQKEMTPLEALKIQDVARQGPSPVQFVPSHLNFEVYPQLPHRNS